MFAAAAMALAGVARGGLVWGAAQNWLPAASYAAVLPAAVPLLPADELAAARDEAAAARDPSADLPAPLLGAAERSRGGFRGIEVKSRRKLAG